MSRMIVSAVCLATLAACSNHHSEGTAAQPETAAPVKQKTVFDDQLKALEKAKAMQKQPQADKEKQDKAIEDQGG